MNLTAIIIFVFLALACLALYWSQLKDRKQRGPALPTLILTGLICAMLYLALGNPFQSEEVSTYRAQLAGWQEEAITLEQNLQDDPPPLPDARVRALIKLTYLYRQMQDYAQAEDAARRAVLASNGAPDLILAYGKAQVMNAGGQVTEGAKKAFVLSAALLPENPEPLLFLAVAKAQEGHVAQAREAMETLAQAFPDNEALQRAIAEEMARLPQ